MANIYDVGDLVQVTGLFADLEGAAQDPTVVLITVKKPDGTKVEKTYGVDAAVIKDSIGHYHYDISIDQTGVWWYRWHSTGTGQAATEGHFLVRAQAVV